MIDSQLCNMGLMQQMYVIAVILMGVIGYNFTIGRYQQYKHRKTRLRRFKIIDSQIDSSGSSSNY